MIAKNVMQMTYFGNLDNQWDIVAAWVKIEFLFLGDYSIKYGCSI